MASAFLFDLTTKGYTFDLEGSVWTAFQRKVSNVQWGISSCEGGLVSVKAACPAPTDPKQPSCSSKVALQNKLTIVMSKKTSVGELEITLVLGQNPYLEQYHL